MTTLLMTLDAVGGVWRYAMDLGRGLRGRGYRLAFAGFGPPPPAAARAEAEALGPLDWCEAPLEWMVQDPGALGGVGPQIAAAAARHGAGLLHLNLPGQAAGLDGRLPVVAVCHSCLATWFAAVRGTALPADWAWQGRMTRAGLRAADAVVAPSRAHAEAMRACHGAIARLDVVHNAAPAAVAAAAAAAAQPGTPRPLVAAAGRWWDEGKGAATLDAAAAAIAWPVAMAGATTAPDGTAVALRHARRLGPLPHPEVLALLQGAGVFVSPSRYEPFGLAALEAAAGGVPLVLSDIATYRELWDGAALFFAPGDAAGLAAAANRLIAEPDLRARLGAAARARAARYTLEAQVDAMDAIYERVRARRFATTEAG